MFKFQSNLETLRNFFKLAINSPFVPKLNTVSTLPDIDTTNFNQRIPDENTRTGFNCPFL